MYDLHAYARARQIELEQSLSRAVRAGEAARHAEPRPRGKITRLFFGESPQARAA